MSNDLPRMNNSYTNNGMSQPQRPSVNAGPFGNHYSIDSTAGSIAGGTGIGNFNDLDNKSVSSTPSKISKFTYSGKLPCLLS